MDVSTIAVSPREAARKLAEYGGTRRKDPTYAAVLEAYEKAAEGGTLLVLSQVIREAPKDEKGRPRLAVARSDRAVVRFHQWARSDVAAFRTWEQYGSLNTSPRQPRNSEVIVSFPSPGVELDGYSLVPIVPPAVAEGHDLALRFTLWEVEQWQDRNPRVADRDPYLLERIAADLFVVVGEWDLTDLERAIMAGRVQQQR